MTSPHHVAPQAVPDEALTGSGRDRRGGLWTGLAILEVGLATAVVLADWFIPSLVLVVMATVSLTVQRRGPASLGFHRPTNSWRLVGQMLAFAAAWSLVNVAVLIPITNHVSGRRQDVSVFADLEGNLGLLVAYLALSWVLAAFCEETAFRGYLLTRLRDVLGNGRWGVAAAVVLSSALFGLLHTEQGVVGVIISGITGAVFAALRYKFGTLWAPVLAHGFGDTIGFTWFFFFGPMYGLW